MAALPWIRSGEKSVGRGHATLADVDNRPLRTMLTTLGVDPDANFIGSSLSPMTVLASGSTTARSLATRMAEVLNVRDFGAVGDGVTDDSAAVQAAITAAQNGNKVVYLPFGTYMVNNLTVTDTSSFLKVVGHGYGCSRLSKNDDGTLVSINGASTNGVEFHGVDFLGNGNTFSGKGVSIDLGGTYTRIQNCFFAEFEDYAIDVDTSTGWHLIVDATIVQPLGSDPTGKSIRIGRSGSVDAGARFRRIFNSFLGGVSEIYGTLDLIVQGCNLSNMVMDDACEICSFVGTVYGAGGTAITLDGPSNAWTSCRWSAGPLTLASTLVNSSVEGVLTSGSIVDNTSRGDNHIAVRDGNFDVVYRGNAHQKHVGEMRVNGDEAQSLGIADARDQVWNTPLTVDRNCNLPSTNLYAGMWGRITRTAAATGASNLKVNGNGGLLKNLAVGTWCEWGCDGTTLYLTAYGAL